MNTGHNTKDFPTTIFFHQKIAVWQVDFKFQVPVSVAYLKVSVKSWNIFWIHT